MAQEVERKFLVKNDLFLQGMKGEFFRQGYLPAKSLTTIRVRVVGDSGFLTIKGENHGITRTEFEYSIPVEDANAMLEKLCERPFIEKLRYRIPMGEVCWEVDRFFGENEGLVIAEVELESENQVFEKPQWLGEEVSNDARYYNSNLARCPYKHW